MSVEELKDRDEIRAFLTRDRVGNAYLLGDLDPAYLPYCTWYGFRVEGELEALFLLYTGLRLPTLLIASRAAPEQVKGQRPSWAGLLAQMKLPSPLWVHAWERHQPALEEHFVAPSLKRMLRMGLHRDGYVRPSGVSNANLVRRLEHADTAAIIALYRHFPDNFFEPYQLETGLYFGIDASNGDKGLAAIAGIHVHSQSHDIAAIGNLLVHPDWRRRGYATAVTARLLDALFETVSLVTLNVEEGNVAAIGTYKKFGFAPHRVYFEGRVETL